MPLSGRGYDDFATTAFIHGRPALLIAAPLVAVLVPIGEELFFRRHLYRWSRDRCGRRYAYVLSSSLFALGHVSLPLMPMHFAAGLCLAWGYERSRTLVVPIIAHVLINSIVFVPQVVAS